jgi:sigma-E factor negative regulatory protein RseA
MKEQISALMDGELDAAAATRAIDSLQGEPETLDTWRAYHLISDAMRDTRLLSPRFAEQVLERLEAEPTVLAPGRLRSKAYRWTRLPAAAAAGLAAFGLVGYLAFGLQPDAGLSSKPMAQAGDAVQAQRVSGKPTLIPLPVATPDYLLAHQGFSPRISLQGMAPYARTVSDQANEGRK